MVTSSETAGEVIRSVSEPPIPSVVTLPPLHGNLEYPVEQVVSNFIPALCGPPLHLW